MAVVGVAEDFLHLLHRGIQVLSKRRRETIGEHLHCVSQSRASPAARRTFLSNRRAFLNALPGKQSLKMSRAAPARRVPTRNWWTYSGSFAASRTASGR